MQKQKLLDNYSKISNSTASKTNIDEQILELITEHKKEIENLIGYSLSYEAILNAIDNAPTVLLPDFKAGYKQAIIDGKTNFSRPQGEWIDTGSGQECNVCHEIQYGYDNFRHFCANCGADMRGENTNS